MKQIISNLKRFSTRLLLLAAMVLVGQNAWADGVTIGSTNNDAAWWTAFSDYYNVPSGYAAHIRFKNYSLKEEDYQNWALVTIVNGTERGGTGYSEYFVLRPDNLSNFTWGDYSDASSVKRSYNPESSLFREHMDGSSVDMYVYNKNKKIYVTATITTSKDTVYTYTYNSLATGADDFKFFFTVEKAHLENFDVTLEKEADDFANIGATDNSAAWWTAFSNYYDVASGKAAHIRFKNYSSKKYNWNNWVLVTSAYGDTKTEYFVLRNDWYGWGTYSGLSDGVLPYVSHDFNKFKDEKFKDDMDGSDVDMVLYNTGGIIYMTATIIKSSDRVFTYSFNSTATGVANFRFFFTVEESHIEDFLVDIIDMPKISTDLETMGTVTVGVGSDFSINSSNAISYQWYSNNSSSYLGSTKIDNQTATYTYTASEEGTKHLYCDAISGRLKTHSTICAAAAKILYKVTFDAGDNGTCAIYETTETSTGIELPDVTANSGYTFLGWSATKGSLIVDKKAHDTYYPSSHCTLYAVYAYELDESSLTQDTLTELKNSGEEINIEGKRTFYTGYVNNTICFPFELSAEKLASSPLADCSLYSITAATVKHKGSENQTIELTLELLTGDAKMIEAGKPYIIRNSGENNIENPVFNTVIVTAVEGSSVGLGDVTLKSTLVPMEVTADDKSIMFMGSDGTLKWPSVDGTIKAFRCYFEISE